MTLIVGIKASDGVVLGADGAATLASASSFTVRQSVKKLSIVKGQVIVGVSGSVGLSQRIVSEVDGLWEKKQLSNRSSSNVMIKLRQELWKHIGMELQVADVAQKVLGQAAQSSATAHTVVGLPCNGMPRLYQFDRQGAPEEATEDLPFVAIGSGQPIADPFLAFLRRIFWKDRLPNLSEGVFAALWTLLHAIETSPGFVSEPVQIVVLESAKKSAYQARELEEPELQEHREGIAHIEGNMADLRRQFTHAEESESPQSPPTPPKT